MPKLGYIQALRAIAVLMVLLQHYDSASFFGRTGYAGVDLFFVISGFIMVRTTTRSDGSRAYVADFFVKRASRIWPPYFVITLIAAAVLFPLSYWQDAAALRWLAASVSMKPLWVVPPVVKPGWSLSFEMYFYAIFGVSLLAGRRRWAAFAGVIVLTMVALPLLHEGRFAFYGIAYGFSSTGLGAYLSMVSHQIIWNFVIGVLVGLVSLSRFTIGSAPARLALIAGTYALACYLYLNHQLDHGLPWGLAFGALVLALDLQNKVAEIRVPRWLVAIGNMSFSIYLTQVFTIYVFDQYVRPFYANDTPVSWLALAVMFVAITLAFSALSYVVLERWLSERVRRWMAWKSPAMSRGSSSRPSSPGSASRNRHTGQPST